MELVAILHVLWRRRLLAAAGVAAIALAVLALVPATPSPPTAVAQASVLLDQRESLVVDPNPIGSDTLGIRATLIGDLMAGDPVAAEVARTAHIPPDQLLITGPAQGLEAVATPLAVATSAAARTPRPYMLDVAVDAGLPIVRLGARAPDVATATRIVQAAGTSLERLTAANGSARHGLVARSLGPPQVSSIPPGTGRLKSALVFVLLSGLWCLGVVAVASASATRRRRVVA